jgi:putative ubiquitin-RnfH superfamily antitoxin RatB of RatAB toxin-antitoxin module
MNFAAKRCATMADSSRVDSGRADLIGVEVVYAEAQRQVLRKVEIAENSTVAEAIAASGILDDLPGFTAAAIGIFGKIVTPATRLRAGDRIELYRPLQADPKDARRRRARLKPQL